MPEGDRQDSQFDLKVLRAATVELEIDTLIRKLQDTPEKVEPIELLAAIRKWFATASWTDAWVHIVQDWQNAKGYMVNKVPTPLREIDGSLYVVGPLNVAWRDLFIRILTSQVQERFAKFDVSSNLGAMGKIPSKLKRSTQSIREWFT